MSEWRTVDWIPGDPSALGAARELVADLAEQEGPFALLLPAEFSALLDAAAGAEPLLRLWFADRALLGLGLLERNGTLRAVLRPEHREMSLFLPILRWAEDSARTWRPAPPVRVVAHDDDVCLPFLLLRLGFSAEGEGWAREGGAGLFRFYVASKESADGLALDP